MPRRSLSDDTMNLWQRLGVLCVFLSLVACGGGTSTTSLTPASPPLIQGDITVQSAGSNLNLTVRFPQMARLAPTTSDGTSSIPFGTDDIRIAVNSTTSAFPYEQEAILTPANPVGQFSAST